MKLRGPLLVIICCLVVEVCNLSRKEYICAGVVLEARILAFAFEGVLFMLYPLVGHLTDVYLTRYRSLKWSLGILLITTSSLLIYCITDIAVSGIWKTGIIYHLQVDVPVYCIVSILLFIGLALFLANAIQFGLDQLLEAPTPKLIAFIHWYYWAQNVGRLVLMYTLGIGLLILDGFDKITKGALSDALNRSKDSIIIVPLCITVTSIVAAIFVKFFTSRKHLYVQKAGLNPFKNIYKVLKYSWKHKVPEHRSAFTYWEEDIPRRIDLGKNKYGGPFTNEEVEDTKTFLRILPLLLCLFGYHLAGDGYSAPEQLQRTSCPSLPVLLLIVFNPLHLSTLVAVVGIPLYRLVIVKVIPRLKNVRMLTKMWIGLYFSLLQVVLYIIVVVNHDTTYWQQHHTNVANHTFSMQCLIIRKFGRSHNFVAYKDDPVDNTYLWFIIPQLLNGLSSLLVSMTVFEFICAQAPRTTQGLCGMPPGCTLVLVLKYT